MTLLEFKRQINEHKRKIEEKANEVNLMNMQRRRSHDVSEHKYEEHESTETVYSVEFDHDTFQYNVNSPGHSGKDSLQIFQITVNEDEVSDGEWSWAVFRGKRVKNQYGVQANGFWEVRGCIGCMYQQQF